MIQTQGLIAFLLAYGLLIFALTAVIFEKPSVIAGDHSTDNGL